MTEKPISSTPEKQSIGGDLVIPAVGLVFTLYYFSTIIDSPWTAQVSAFFIGAVLIALIVAFFVKSVVKVRRGEADFGFSGLFNRADITSGRLWLFVIMLLYVFLIEWGGFTLTTFGFLFSGMLVLSKGRRKGLIALMSTGLALGGYGLFIIAFETRFPHGPFEWLMAMVL
jgi:hypothetical protein